eukprot:TRINITY_DN3216_c0_g1_i16.p1 TRINITY_DN3216_c0_g1~~TRINITY_DN3216_c0_g1_i16.p1  ORF type:complete len:326 (-),score=48.64 TRINITY_DN3216_c0_g1_i16:140-1117(-)
MPFEPFIYTTEYDLAKGFKKYWKLGLDKTCGTKLSLTETEKSYCVKIDDTLNSIVGAIQSVAKSKIVHIKASFAIWSKENGSVELWLIGCEKLHFDKSSKELLIIEGRLLNSLKQLNNYSSTSNKSQSPPKNAHIAKNRTDVYYNLLFNSNKSNIMKRIGMNKDSKLNFSIKRSRSNEIDLITTMQRNMNTDFVRSYIKNSAYFSGARHNISRRSLLGKMRPVMRLNRRVNKKALSTEERKSVAAESKPMLCFGKKHMLKFTMRKPITHQASKRKCTELKLKPIMNSEELDKPSFSVIVTRPRQARNLSVTNRQLHNLHADPNYS